VVPSFARTKVWTQTFDLSNQTDPEEFLAEISQLQQQLEEVQAEFDDRVAASSARIAVLEDELQGVSQRLQESTEARAEADAELDRMKEAAQRRRIGFSRDVEVQVFVPLVLCRVLRVPMPTPCYCHCRGAGASLAAELEAAKARIQQLEAQVVAPDTDQAAEVVRYATLRVCHVVRALTTCNRLRQEGLEKDATIQQLQQQLNANKEKLVRNVAPFVTRCCHAVLSTCCCSRRKWRRILLQNVVCR